MRNAILVVLLTLLLVPPAWSERTDEPRRGISVTLLDAPGAGVTVAWTPAPAVLVYEVYRGPSLSDLTLIATTSETAYHDADARDGATTWYVIIGHAVPIMGAGLDLVHDMRGECVTQRGTGASVTVRNCTPASVG